MRRSGVLLPIFSLPSPYGIGTLGREAYDFVDFLKKAGQSLWQILPLGPTGYGDSPYQSFSSFAGNPYFIDLEELIAEGLLTKADCQDMESGINEADIDYEAMYFKRFVILRKAYERGKQKGMLTSAAFKRFVKEQGKVWLDDYALYMAVKNHFGGVCFMEWDEDIRRRTPAALAKYQKELADEIGFYRFQQFLFDVQWAKLKKYANKMGIQIVGDIPIYVAFDSADLWANPSLFELDSKGYPTQVAGCPPDCFTAEGQLWGNPLYNWRYHKETGYAWWILRMQRCLSMYDIVRIDHFRGFDEYWAVPYGDKNAIGGKWRKGPGYPLFKAINDAVGEGRVIAEDLGFITDSVRTLIRRCGYPGMKILQFAFDDTGCSDYLPHFCDRNSVVYTGTHDNYTLVGFVNQMPKADAKFAMKYYHVKTIEKLPKAYIRSAMATNAETCIIPLQDYLGLGDEARINTPSTLGTNWRWRMEAGVLTPELAKKMRKLAKTYGRLAPEPEKKGKTKEKAPKAKKNKSVKTKTEKKEKSQKTTQK